MNSPVARVFAVFSFVLAVVTVLFNAYILVTPHPAPATSASVVAIPVPAPVDTTSTAVPFPPPDDFDLRSRQASWCVHHGGVPTMTFMRNGSNVLCLKPEAIIALP